MKKLVISTLAVFAVTLTYAQDLKPVESTRLNNSGQKERIVRVKPKSENVVSAKKMQRLVKKDLHSKLIPLKQEHKNAIKSKEEIKASHK